MFKANFCYILLIDQVSLSGWLYFVRYWAIVCKPGCEVMNFAVNFIFLIMVSDYVLIKPFFLHEQKIMTKTYVSWEWKKLLRWNIKHFSSFLRFFNEANNTFFGMCEPTLIENFRKLGDLGIFKKTLDCRQKETKANFRTFLEAW